MDQNKHQPAGRPLRQERRRAARRRRRRLKRFMTGLSVFCLIAALVSLCVFFHLQKQEAREREVFEQLQKKYEQAVSDSASDAPVQPTAAASAQPETPGATAAPQPSEQPVVSAWAEELYSENPDLVGWLNAGGEISVPLVYRDNEYYLNRDFYGNESKSGAVFVDERNERWQDDQYVLIYGHNMRDGMMFGELDRYMTPSYFREQAEVEIRLLYGGEVRSYVPFAVVDCSVDPDSDMYFRLRRFDLFGEERDRQQILAFFNEIRRRSVISVPDLEISTEDTVIGLVTCSYTYPDARTVLFCREVRPDESAEELTGLIRSTAHGK